MLFETHSVVYDTNNNTVKNIILRVGRVPENDTDGWPPQVRKPVFTDIYARKRTPPMTIKFLAADVSNQNN